MDSRAWTLAILLVVASPATAAELSVRVHTPDGAPLDQAVVLVDGVPAARGDYPMTTAVIDQINRAFVPNVSVIRAGTMVTFPNHDDIRHHVYSFSDAKTFELPLYQGLMADPVQFGTTGIVTLACNIHDWMLAFVYVTDAEWFGQTNEQGVLVLDIDGHDSYEVTVWHPNLGTETVGLTQRIERGTAALDVEIAASEGRGVRRLRRGTGRYR